MRKILAIALILCLLVCLCACAKTPASTPAPAPAESTGSDYEPVSLRFAYMPNMGGASLLVTAEEFGFFDKYNIDAQLVEFGDGPSEISAMASGDIDIAMIGHGAHALCCEGSAVVFYSDAIGLSSAVVANKSSGISSLADLAGKSVAYVAGTASEELLKLALSKVNLTMDDIEAVNFDVAGMVTAMSSGQVDAAASSQPYTSTIAKQLGDKFVTLCEDRDYLSERTLMNSEICTKTFAEENPELLTRVACALMEAADYRTEHIDDVAMAVAEQCEGDKETFKTLTNECIWLTGKEVVEYLEANELENYYANAQSTFLSSGRLTTEVPVTDYVLFDIMAAAGEIVYGK